MKPEILDPKNKTIFIFSENSIGEDTFQRLTRLNRQKQGI